MHNDVQHDDWLYQQLQDAGFAAEYLNAASEDDDPKTYVSALRKVAEARGGISVIAQNAGISRESLYRMLSSRGNPTLKTLAAVLKSTGLKMVISPHSHPGGSQ
jgi:probable addiction module antidote protein